METVAELAGTSKSVLYRRWPTRAALVLATVQHHVKPIESNLPDTGDLRGDLLAVLAQVREHFEQIGPAIVHGLMAERADLPEDIDAVVPGVITRLLDRAADRGQLRPVTITPLMAALPGSLLRHELLLARRPASDEFLAEVVDEIFLPLVTLRAT
jgi:AcrR family transcriptional regulator